MKNKTKTIARNVKRQKPVFHRVCRECGDDFTTNSNRQVFCLKAKCTGGKYQPEQKVSVLCVSCGDRIMTSRRNQTHCSKDVCQQARNTAKMNRFILDRAKRIEEDNAKLS